MLLSVEMDEMRPLNSKVRYYMIRDVATLPKDTKIWSIAKMIVDYAVGSVIIVDECRRPIGIITARDLVKKTIAYRTDNPLAESAEEIMTHPVICVSQDSTMQNALGLMIERNVKRLPVVDTTGQLVGVITTSKILDAFNQTLDDESVGKYINDVVKVLEALKTSREVSGKPEVPQDKDNAIEKTSLFESDESIEIPIKEKKQSN